MTAPDLNAQLAESYQAYTQSIYAQTWDDDVSAPLLMHVFDEYCEMPNKILFVGQETFGWNYMRNKPDVDELTRMYRNFALGKPTELRDGKKQRIITSPFWNFCRTLFYEANHRDATVSKQTNGFLWTNISKFDSGSTTPSHDLQDRNKEGFELLKTEIAILKPDVVVFLTGSKYDGRINTVFNPAREAILPDGYLYQLSTADNSLPLQAFQTKHPRTLLGSRRNKVENRYQEVLGKVGERVIC